MTIVHPNVIEACVQDLIFLSREDRDLGFPFQTPPGSQASPRGHQCMKLKSESEVTELCPTLSDSMDCNPPGSSVHGIFQAGVLEWGAIAFSVKILPIILLQRCIYYMCIKISVGFPCGSAGKESACSEGDLGSIPGMRSSPGEGNANPLSHIATSIWTCMNSAAD